MFTAFLVGCAHSRLEIRGQVASWIRRLAAYTFTFYLLHFTLFVFCNALGWRQVPAWHFVGITLATFAITWAHAQVGELRRVSYARVIDRWLPWKG
jgi:peptidoglycan/LPS O-acetylase OafA/YrhL